MINNRKIVVESIAFLIPMIWLMRTASRGLTYWFYPEAGMALEVDYVKGSPIDRTFLLILEIIGIIILLARGVNLKLFAKKNALILLLYGYMGISVLWSDFPDVSFKRWIRTCGDLIMVMVIITEFSYPTVIAKILRYSAYILIPLSVIFIKYFRELGVTYDTTGTMEMWIGVSTHKNSLGQLSCVSAIFFLWVLFSKQYKKIFLDIPVLLLSIWLLQGSSSATSRTSLGVFLFGVVLLILIKLIKNRVIILKAGLSIIIPVIIIASVFTSYFYSQNLFTWIISSTGGDPTLTGRTYLWEEVLKIASRYQPFGTGYGGFWIGGLANDLWNTFVWHPGQAHNGYIDVYVDIGILGLFILLILIISTYRDIFAMLAYNSEFAKFRMLIFSMVLIFNISESSFIKPTSLLWFLFLLVAIKIPEKVPENEYKLVRNLQTK